MKNAIILHGTSSSPNSNWFMWLKDQLEERGYEVWSPQLPGAEKPNGQRYNDFLLGNDFDFNKETILIGHSSGSVEILNLLQHLPGDTVIKLAVLVGAFKDDMGWDSLKELFIGPLDFNTIKSRSEKIIFIHSDNDPRCPLEGAKYLSDKLGASLLVKKGQGHFNMETGPQYKEFPYLVEVIEKALTE